MFGRRSPELMAAQARCESLEREVERLSKQIEQLQMALISARAPEAYQDIMAQRAASEETEQERAKMAEQNQESGILAAYAQYVEEPVLQSPDDLIHLTRKLMGKEPEVISNLEMSSTQPPSSSESVHQNPES